MPLVTRRTAPWEAAVEVLVGVMLTSVGVGVGLNHVLQRGAAWGGVLGLLGGACGLVLLAHGGTTLARATRGWWRPGVVLLLLLVAVVGVYVLAVPLRAAVPARSPVAVDAPAGLDAQEVDVPTTAGAVLAGWYVPSGNGAAVVLLPGAGSSRDAVVGHLRTLTEAGYGVLALDPRGQGRSTGRGMDWGWYGEEDVPSAVSFLAGRDDVDPGRIALVGLSMGGEQAVGAAGVDDRVRAVVAEGVTARSVADLDWLSEVYGWRGALTEGVHAAQTVIADLLSPADRPPALREAVAAAAPRPLLLVVAGRVPDEQHAAEDLRSASPGTVRTWVVPGAGHTGALRTDPAGWSEHVVGFLDAATE